MIHNCQPNANYFETTCINSESDNVPHTANTRVSLPNPNLNSTYEPQEQLPLTNLYSYNPLMQSNFHQSFSRRAQCPLLNKLFPNTSASFVYQPLLSTKIGPPNPPTVTFTSNSHYVTQPSNVQQFFSGGAIFYVGTPNAVNAAIYSKPLMAPYTSENKQSGLFTSSDSKPITNQDLAEILTLSQKGPLLEW